MAFGTGTMNSATPVKDLAAVLGTGLTSAGFTQVDSYASPGNGAWNQVVYGGGKFLSPSSNAGTVMMSSDGQNWVQRTTPINPGFTCAAYGNGTWVVLANGATSYSYSTDGGTTWLTGNMAVAGAWGRNLVFGNGLFLAFNLNNVYTSPDGINWTTRAGVLPTSTTWTAAAYGGGTFAVLNSGTAAAVSTDGGTTWVSKTLTAISANTVTYANGMFVALGNNASSLTSPDGNTWTARTMPSASNWYATAYGASTWVAVASNLNNTAISTDNGQTWTVRTAALPNSTWFGVAFGGAIFAAAGNSVVAASSTDGLTWTSRNPSGTATTPWADVWKSPGTSNSFGQDWYLILRRTGEANGAFYFQVAETYDAVNHRASNVGGLYTAVVPNATTYTNPTVAAAPDSSTIIAASAFLAVTIGVAFTYWYSITPDRVIVSLKTSTETGFYAGLYEDLLPTGVTQFPLVCAMFPTYGTGATASAWSIGGSGPGAVGGFTREPLATASNFLNFTAVIHNGMSNNAGSFTQAQQNYMPLTTVSALYGNVGALSRAMIGTSRALTTTIGDGVRGLLYGCVISAVNSIAGDTITSGGKTYLRFCGTSNVYGFFVDQAL